LTLLWIEISDLGEALREALRDNRIHLRDFGAWGFYSVFGIKDVIWHRGKYSTG
jgi:hypothetical protein